MRDFLLAITVSVIGGITMYLIISRMEKSESEEPIYYPLETDEAAVSETQLTAMVANVDAVKASDEAYKSPFSD